MREPEKVRLVLGLDETMVSCRFFTKNIPQYVESPTQLIHLYKVFTRHLNMECFESAVLQNSYLMRPPSLMLDLKLEKNIFYTFKHEIGT